MPREIADFVLTLSCDDRKGLVAAIANFITAQDCNIVESEQYCDPISNRFFMRIAFAKPEWLTRNDFATRFEPVALGYDLDWQLRDLSIKPRVLIMVSKMGHCLNDLLYRHFVGNLNMDLVGVASNHETWRKRVEHEGLPYHYLPVTKDTKAEQEARILDIVERENVDLVVLARYMQVLSDDLSSRLFGKVINIHHSFLPSFKGAKPYHRAHARGVKMIGATAHYVTADLDEGPIIEQDTARVTHSMTAEEFVAKGRDVECAVLARAVKAHLEHKVLLNGERTVVFS